MGSYLGEHERRIIDEMDEHERCDFDHDVAKYIYYGQLSEDEAVLRAWTFYKTRKQVYDGTK